MRANIEIIEDMQQIIYQCTRLAGQGSLNLAVAYLAGDYAIGFQVSEMEIGVAYIPPCDNVEASWAAFGSVDSIALGELVSILWLHLFEV